MYDRHVAAEQPLLDRAGPRHRLVDKLDPSHRHGPFKFIEFQANERITVALNPDYWKKAFLAPAPLRKYAACA